MTVNKTGPKHRMFKRFESGYFWISPMPITPTTKPFLKPLS